MIVHPTSFFLVKWLCPSLELLGVCVRVCIGGVGFAPIIVKMAMGWRLIVLCQNTLSSIILWFTMGGDFNLFSSSFHLLCCDLIGTFYDGFYVLKKVHFCGWNNRVKG